MSLILATSSHFTINPALAKKQICSKWDVKGAFAPNLEPKWEKSLIKTSTNGYLTRTRNLPENTRWRVGLPSSEFADRLVFLLLEKDYGHYPVLFCFPVVVDVPKKALPQKSLLQGRLPLSRTCLDYR
jgi:hypothetical protein